MPLYSIITIDTECDKGAGWEVQLPIKLASVTPGIPAVLQRIFNKHGAKPTYLLSPEVIADHASAQTLKNIKDAELGAHLHCEYVAPNPNFNTKLCEDYQAHYPYEVEFEKIKNLTQLFENRIGYRPVSFRAGRFGIGKNSLKILQELGYLIDCSVTPYTIWNYPFSSIDFHNAPDSPYFPSEKNFLTQGEMSILEVPVTIYSSYVYLKNQLPYSIQNNPSFFKCFSKIPGLNPLWLRPSTSSFSQMQHVVDEYIKLHRPDRNIVLNMMFHNVEAIENASPYNKSSQDITLFLERLEKIIVYIKTLGAEFATLQELQKIFSKDRHLLTQKG